MNGLYVHIPFCDRKCPYCSFPVVIAQEQQARRYVDAVMQEARTHAGETFVSAYLGGGTPSLLPLDELERLLTFLRAHFNCSRVREWTLEVNPEHVGAKQAQRYQALGITRISLGAQSTNNTALTFLGRRHNREHVRSAVDHLKQSGMTNINVDMIFSWPGQTQAQLLADAEDLLSLDGTHISVYSLTVEPQSRFFVEKIIPLSPEEDACLYQVLCQRLTAAGYQQYEVSNFAKPGFACQHNVNGWRSGNYLGLGMGAHSHWEGRRSWNQARFWDYLKQVESGAPAQAGEERLSPEQRMREALVFGLRLCAGVDCAELQRRFGQEFSQEVSFQIHRFIRQGWLEYRKDRLQATPQGLLRLDSLLVYLV